MCYHRLHATPPPQNFLRLVKKVIFFRIRTHTFGAAAVAAAVLAGLLRKRVFGVGSGMVV